MKTKFIFISVLILIILVLIKYQFSNFPSEGIYVKVEGKLSWPIELYLYDNEYVELTPIEYKKIAPNSFKFEKKAISLDSLLNFLKQKSPPQIIESNIYIIQEDINEEKVITVKPIYVLVD